MEARNVAEKVLNKLRSLSACGFRSELKELDDKLSMITAALMDDEKQRVKKFKLSWVRRVKDVLYQAEDVFDEFEYEASRSQVPNHRCIPRKVCNFFFRSKMGHKIKDIRKKLEVIINDETMFNITRQIEDWRVMHVKRGTDSSVEGINYKFVYNDERVAVNFQLRMWVYVSKDFGVKKLIERNSALCNCKKVVTTYP
ncbi:hypothetical protein L1049_008077 [Liquidambar formosana]|uniref:Disease resistance N-terminal domain-containing protein n=1 Tax=Liquidambar formosana TaxID=63359 RepID=A0AAP0X4C0_LIQFO